MQMEAQLSYGNEAKGGAKWENWERNGFTVVPASLPPLSLSL